MHRITVRGVVQGVGFRPSVVRAAGRLGSSGYVRNDGSHVTIETDTDPEEFLEVLRAELGPMAMIESTVVSESERDAPDGFTIERSTRGERDCSLPYDTAVCERCLSEMNDPSNRRYRHPFTNCTDCGARYTVIKDLPYDRERTTMHPFDPCSECSSEYSDISFRRFHAQTLSCGKDGPMYRFLDGDLKEVSAGWDSFLDCAEGIATGKLIVVKGWGGMHIVSDPERLPELRRWYGRPYKPFAIMVDSIETAGEIARIGGREAELLSSPARPIVLCRKTENPPSWASNGLEHASPGLGNIGIYLPYSGIHHLLFSALSGSSNPLRWFLMTSANPPGEPMALDLDSASIMKADGYFVHDRKIASRCDDSVLLPLPSMKGWIGSRGPFGIRASMIRKARGLIPDPIGIGHQRTVLSIGAERNVTVTVTKSGRAFTSPYVGNTRHPSVLEYARDSTRRFSSLFGADDLEAVVCDLHPRYATRSLARELSEERDVPLLEVQHHHAHAASLMADAKMEGLGCVVIDGVGYGTDGLPWGGEMISCKGEEWCRNGHLENFGLPGGDSSVYHPERIAHWLTTESGSGFNTGDPDSDKVLESSHHNAIMTSSFGRLLDALSAMMLGVTWRSYDGEPAIRMETLLAKSRSPDTEPFSFPVRDGIVPVIDRWRVLLEGICSGSTFHPGSGLDIDDAANLSMGFVSSILDDMVHVLAVSGDTPRDGEGRPLIGLSGGVAYNVPITERFVSTCIELDAAPVLHSRIPPGDGGISIGQALIGGRLLQA